MINKILSIFSTIFLAGTITGSAGPLTRGAQTEPPSLAAGQWTRAPSAQNVSQNPVPASEIFSKIPRENCVAGTFEQTKILLDLDIELRSRGEFVFSQNAGALWQTLEPVKSTILITDDALTIFDKNDRPTKTLAIAANAVAQEIAQIIKNAMLGDFASLEKLFEISAGTPSDGNENPDGNADSWELQLLPKESALPFAKISLRGNANSLTQIDFLSSDEAESTTIFIAKLPTALAEKSAKKIDEFKQK